MSFNPLVEGFENLLRQKKSFYILASLVLLSLCTSGFAQLDKTRYITIDEIKPGMQAYCLTTYHGTKVERFDLQVLSVVRDYDPGKNAIMVMGTDQRFIHTGPVAGCSGSPVYIDGRLAGALAFGWSYSKDPLYGVTPIEEMLRVGSGESYGDLSDILNPLTDFSKPLDLKTVYENINKPIDKAYSGPAGASILPSPMIVSGMPGQTFSELDNTFSPMGLMAVTGASSANAPADSQPSQLEIGGPLAVPLVTGDISMTVMGTVTDIIGDQVFGFGHSFLGYGPIELPMATGTIHTVVSSMVRSFKFGSANQIVGSIKADESTAVRGEIGTMPKMIPLELSVKRYNDPDVRVYNCQIAKNEILTPQLLGSVASGAVNMIGPLPRDNTVRYNVEIGIQGQQPIKYSNVSTGLGVAELLIEIAGTSTLVMNNPFSRLDLTHVKFDIDVLNRDSTSRIWTLNVPDRQLKPGQSVDIDIVLESVLADKKKYTYTLDIPENLSDGKYTFAVMGAYHYEKFLKKARPNLYTASNIDTLIAAVRNSLSIDRGKMYCVLMNPASGVTIANAQLPDLPGTKSLLMLETKNTLETYPYMQWQEKQFQTDSVLMDEKTVEITVKK